MKGVLMVAVTALMLGVAAPAQAAPARVACDDSSWHATFNLDSNSISRDLAKVKAAFNLDDDTLANLYGTFLAADAASAYVNAAAEQPCSSYQKSVRVRWMTSMRWMRKAGLALEGSNWQAALTAMRQADAAIKR